MQVTLTSPEALLERIAQSLEAIERFVTKRNTHAPKRGRPTTYDWAAFYLEVSVYIASNGLPEHRAKLEDHMGDWCGENWDEIPTSSVLR